MITQHFPAAEPAAIRLRKRPGVLLIAAALSAGFCAATPAAYAQANGAANAPAETAPATRSWSIAAGPLATALARFVEAARVNVLFEPEWVAGRTSPGVSGEYGADQALAALLVGSGLVAERGSTGGFVLKAVPAGEGATMLPAVRVESEAATHASPPAYAGGQVARGGRLGLLGNRDFMETPFNQTSYTAGYIEDIQAQTLRQALEASPSIRRSGGRYSSEDNFSIRGFFAGAVDTTYDGMHGLGTFRRISLHDMERVEVLKGPSALLYGVPPDGGVGGTINLVPKRATTTPVTTFTVQYDADSRVEGHVDIGRRFGEGQKFGVRLNAVHGEGDTPFDNNSERLSLVSVALDYLGEDLRLFANLNYEDQQQDAAGFGSALAAAVPVPDAPDASTNFAAPFTKTTTERSYNILRAEYDVTDDWVAEVGYGWQNSDELQFVHFATQILNVEGDYAEPSFYRFREGDYDYKTVNASLTGSFRTGPLRHTLALAGHRVTRDVDSRTRNAFGEGIGGGIFNIYSPDTSRYTRPDFSNIAPSRAQIELTQEGLAVSDTISVLEDRLQLTVGVRDQNIRNKNAATGVVNYDESRLTPAYAVMFRATASVALYANYIEGLAQAPSPPSTAVNADEVFDPARTEQREAGLKLDLGGFAGTVSVFEISQPNGVTDPGTNVFSLDGEQRNRGVELETFGEIRPGLRLLGGIAFIDAELTRTQNGTNDGKTASGTPEFRANLYGEWDAFFLPRLTLTGQLIHTDEQYLDTANTRSIPDWTRIDVGARYLFSVAGSDVTLRLRITNLLGKDYWENSGLALGEPRTLSLSTTISL